MSDINHPFAPGQLRPQQIAILAALLPEIDPQAPDAELARVEEYLERIGQQAAVNPNINARLGEAIVASFRSLVAGWARIPAPARPWVSAAMRYFWYADDELNDFESFMGLEDDCAVLNACARLAGREDLLVHVERFD